MPKWVLRSVALIAGLGIYRYAPDPWSYLGLGLFVLVVLDVMRVGRRPAKEWEPVDPQDVTVVHCGPKPIEVIKVLREYLEPDPGAATLQVRLTATPSQVGRVPSTAAAAELSGRLESLQTLATFRAAT